MGGGCGGGKRSGGVFKWVMDSFSCFVGFLVGGSFVGCGFLVEVCGWWHLW